MHDHNRNVFVGGKHIDDIGVEAKTADIIDHVSPLFQHPSGYFGLVCVDGKWNR